jgi:hypothetical protein
MAYNERHDAVKQKDNTLKLNMEAVPHDSFKLPTTTLRPICVICGP